ncbi:MAG TPA: preprotein translocase subunit SecG [Candidatus Onthousia excrementipullorum]|uniref:Protein-export membrane protein SecG n=1 Tax=Candidatus Onthousia excrementipullorum TaxID=2840884 RepID=A0A9D1DTQ5_9FIRM|nr:preprotein translocase subunit SecG [Candidatus Onthousia excrementipullorum]
MQIALLIISILLIIIVLLQSGKAESAAQILSGNSTDLFKNRKERGSELVITRITMVLGAAFFIICLVYSFM